MKSTPPKNARWGRRAKVKHLRGIRMHGVELKEKLLPITLCTHTASGSKSLCCARNSCRNIKNTKHQQTAKSHGIQTSVEFEVGSKKPPCSEEAKPLYHPLKV